MKMLKVSVIMGHGRMDTGKSDVMKGRKVVWSLWKRES